MLEKEYVFDFLQSLHKSLDEVLGKDRLPFLHESFAKVRKEESWQKVMLSAVKEQKAEVFAFAI